MKIINHHKESELKALPNDMKLPECREQLKMLSDNIFKDMSSTIVTSKRIESIRNILDLIERYNRQLEVLEKIDDAKMKLNINN